MRNIRAQQSHRDGLGGQELHSVIFITWFYCSVVEVAYSALAYSGGGGYRKQETGLQVSICSKLFLKSLRKVSDGG